MFFEKAVRFISRVFTPAKAEPVALELYNNNELRAQKELEELYSKYNSLDAETILATLVRIRREYGTLPHYPYHPIFYPVNSEKSLMLYQIMDFVSRSPTLTATHAAWLAQELLYWKEFKQNDSSKRFCILRGVSRFPDKRFVADLELHLCFLILEKKNESIGTHYSADICSEIKQTEELIALCKNA